MALESASFISGLVSANPPGTDAISQGDDHLRLIKTVLKASLPNADEAINGIHTKATEPSSTSAGLIWFDTTDNLIKIRNEANDGWIILLASEGSNLLNVTHKDDSSSNRPDSSDTYENNGMTVSHTKLSSTSTLYVKLDCYLNIAPNFTASTVGSITGYLGGSDASASTMIVGTAVGIMIMFEDVGEGSGVTWDATNTFSRMYKVTAANCPAGSGSTGTQTFNWVWKFNNRDQMTATAASTWMVWEVEE